VASQFHPEFKSRPERPAPLFREFIAAALERAARRDENAGEPGAEAVVPGALSQRGGPASAESDVRARDARSTAVRSRGGRAGLP
jgi:CTP synthase